MLLQVQKTYRTLVGGRLEGEGYVDIPLDGKPSLTEYRSVSQSESGNHGWISTLDLLPHTGMLLASFTVIGEKIGDTSDHDCTVMAYQFTMQNVITSCELHSDNITKSDLHY